MREAPLEHAKHIATNGLSFGIVKRSGAVPPPDVLNDFLACGYDDLDFEDGVLEWKPFALTDAEYHDLLQWWKASHPAARPDRLGTGGADFRDWFTRAVRVIEEK